MANILEEVQQEVAAKLSADSSLSDCTFLVENRKDIDYEIKNALGRQGIVGVVMTPRAIYAGKYEDLFLAWTLEELEIDIVENPVVNRGKKPSYITGQDAAMRVFDVLCPLSGDYEGQFNPVSYEEGEDSGLIVNRCVLKALVYGEHGDTPQPEPGLNMQFVKLLDGPPAQQPHDGWMWPVDGGFVLWQNGQAHELGGVSFDQMSSYVDSATSAFLSAEDIYVKSAYTPLQAWKAVEDTAVKTSNGNLFMPDGSVYALSSLELDVDSSVSVVQLSAVPQFNVDGKGHFTYIGLAYMTIPQPFYFQTADGTTLELGFNVDGAGTYSVVVSNQAQGVIVAQQPWSEPVTDCNLEFDYGESHCKVKAADVYTKASDLNNFVRQFLGIPDDGSTVPTTLQLMEVSASLENYLPLSGGHVNGNLSVGSGIELFNEADGGVVKISDGSSNQTFYQHNKIGTPNGNLYYPVSIPEQDETIATCEWTSRNYTKISAMTEDEYEQITPDPTTLYVITED